MEEERFLKITEVLHITGLCKSVMYEEIAADTFPKQVKRGRASFWVLSEIREWVRIAKEEPRAA